MLTRFSIDMDGSMEPDENGAWVRYEDAAELQEAPVQEDLKDHKCAELVNRLQTIAIAFHNHDQLRERIAAEIRPLFRAAPVQEPTCKQPLQVYKPTGWVAHKSQYAVPVLFSPYTGEPRDVRDVQSDPQGILIQPPGKVEMVAAPQAQQPANKDWDAITAANQKYAPLVKAAINLICAVNENLKNTQSPQCFGVPFGELNALHDALGAQPLAAPQAQQPQLLTDEEMDSLRKDAARYRWLRDIGDKTWIPLRNKWPDGMYTTQTEAYINTAIAAIKTKCPNQ